MIGIQPMAIQVIQKRHEATSGDIIGITSLRAKAETVYTPTSRAE